jgi:hypothetical protein
MVADSYLCSLSAAPVSRIWFGRLPASGIRPVPKLFLNARRLPVPIRIGPIKPGEAETLQNPTRLRAREDASTLSRHPNPSWHYVLAHEVTHILEGEVRHSETGIMKAQWGAVEHFKMARGNLGFAAEDVNLIYRGLDWRESRSAMASASNPVAELVALR